jgi:hypothetical protein
MILKELHAKLKELGIPDDKYYLHGLYGSASDDDKFALVIKKGTYSVEYDVYFKERGQKHSIRTFTNEDDACLFLFHRLKEAKEFEDKQSL